MTAAMDEVAAWSAHKVLSERLILLTGEIDLARRDISAWRHWLDTWADRLRQLWDGGAGLATGEKLTELRGKMGWLEDCNKALEAFALVTVGRLESLEQAFCEWNTAAAPFADRLDDLGRFVESIVAWGQDHSDRLEVLERFAAVESGKVAATDGRCERTDFRLGEIEKRLETHEQWLSSMAMKLPE